ncbi:MAG: DUF433 domain-containing protein [Chloroflexi bacterium]|nr:DUF433 domain-containing protein [Chloroflexota bacterium]
MLFGQANGWRTEPIYRVRDAARLAGVSTETVRRWLQGYQSGERQMPPVFGKPVEDIPRVSFLQLVEVVVASRFRKRRIRLESIRQAHRYARAKMRVDYPFASLNLESVGGHIFHVYDEEHRTSFAVLDTPGMYTLPGIVTDTLQSVDYEGDLAARWYPLGRDVPVVIDPYLSAGEPVIPGRRVRVEVIIKRFRAGQSIRFIARDLKLGTEQVEAVIRHSDQLAA